LLKPISKHEFEALANQRYRGQELRKMPHWPKFTELSLGQLAGCACTEDILSNLSAQTKKLYHLGCAKVMRTTLVRINESVSYTLYEALFHILLSRRQRPGPRHGSRFKGKLYYLDAIIIDLCLSVCSWARFRSSRGVVRVHIGLNHDVFLSSLVTLTDSETHDVSVGRT
jgi:hypothetical protein